MQTKVVLLYGTSITQGYEPAVEPAWELRVSSPPTPRTPWKIEGGRRERKKKK